MIQASVISNLKYDSIIYKKIKLAPNPPIFWDFGQYVIDLTEIQEFKAIDPSPLMLFCWYNMFMLQEGKYKEWIGFFWRVSMLYQVVLQLVPHLNH